MNLLPRLRGRWRAAPEGEGHAKNSCRGFPPPSPYDGATSPEDGGGRVKLDRRVGIEPGFALLEMRGETFLHLGSQESQHLQRRRGIEGGPHHAQPVVERV